MQLIILAVGQTAWRCHGRRRKVWQRRGQIWRRGRRKILIIFIKYYAFGVELILILQSQAGLYLTYRHQIYSAKYNAVFRTCYSGLWHRAVILLDIDFSCLHLQGWIIYFEMYSFRTKLVEQIHPSNDWHGIVKKHHLEGTAGWKGEKKTTF
jgi:hypothetical protein